MAVIAVCALVALSEHSTVTAQDNGPCSGGYVQVESAGGPLCVNPIYLDGTWQDHPASCEWGYFQGSCAPKPTEPVVFAPAAYLFQTIPQWTPAPVLKIDRFHAALQQFG